MNKNDKVYIQYVNAKHGLTTGDILDRDYFISKWPSWYPEDPISKGFEIGLSSVPVEKLKITMLYKIKKSELSQKYMTIYVSATT